MDSNEPNQPDAAGELHAGIIRRRAAELRKSQRDYARWLADHEHPIVRIAEMLEIDVDTVARLIAVDGRTACTECLFGMHSRCSVLAATNDGRLGHCECSACRS